MCHKRLEWIQPSAAELSSRPVKAEGRSFLSAPYVLGEDGHYRCAGRPSQCPEAEPVESCRIKRQARRRRKVGPSFALDVLLCQTHRHSFTVYPPGYGPYERQSLAPVSPSGEPLQEAGCQNKGEERLELWRGTSFRRCPRCCRGPAVVERADRR